MTVTSEKIFSPDQLMEAVTQMHQQLKAYMDDLAEASQAIDMLCTSVGQAQGESAAKLIMEDLLLDYIRQHDTVKQRLCEATAQLDAMLLHFSDQLRLFAPAPQLNKH